MTNAVHFLFFDIAVNGWLMADLGERAEPAAIGWFVHVFVDRSTRRPGGRRTAPRSRPASSSSPWASATEAWASPPSKSSPERASSEACRYGT
jgi:hypothetical protein